MRGLEQVVQNYIHIMISIKSYEEIHRMRSTEHDAQNKINRTKYTKEYIRMKSLARGVPRVHQEEAGSGSDEGSVLNIVWEAGQHKEALQS